MLSNTAVPIEYGRFRNQVLRGETPVNEYISLQMNRIDELIDSPEYYYSDQAINGFVNFCEKEMCLTDGGPVKLLPSFKLWAEDLLAWFYYAEEKYFNVDTQRFEYRRVLRRLRHRQFLIVARGAAKSMYASFIHAYFLYVDKSTTKQIATAPTVEQAYETLSPIQTALTMKRGPLLQFMTRGNKYANKFADKKLAESTKAGIINRASDSILKVRPMRKDKLQGSRAKIATVDEWLSGDTKDDVFGALQQSAAKGNITDYVILGISSEGTVRDGIGDTIKMELVDILRGDYQDHHTSVWYYRLDSLEEVGMPEMWLKANPNLGATVSYETYEQDVRRAETQPSQRSDILAKRFGIPVEGYTYFFRYEETLVHRKQNFKKMVCSLGGDFSQGDDFCAFTLLFPLGGGRYGVKSRAYVCENRVRKLPQAMQNRYDDFVREDSLVIMDRPYLDMKEVYDDFDDWIIENDYCIEAFGYDPYNADYVVTRYTRENGEHNVRTVKQGVRTESVPLGELKNLAEDRCLIFDQEIMKFAMGNSVAIEDNNGNRKLSKKRAMDKIDCVAALLDAWVAYKTYQEDFDY